MVTSPPAPSHASLKVAEDKYQRAQRHLATQLKQFDDMQERLNKKSLDIKEASAAVKKEEAESALLAVATEATLHPEEKAQTMVRRIPGDVFVV